MPAMAQVPQVTWYVQVGSVWAVETALLYNPLDTCVPA